MGLRLIGTSVGGRLGRTFAAHGFSQVVNIISQVLTVPLLLRAWGTLVYQDWLLVIALPSFFTLADLGFGLAVGSEVGRLWAADRLEEANTVYQTGITVILLSCTLCAMIFIPIFVLGPVGHWLGVKNLDPGLTTQLLIVFTLQVLCNQMTGVLRSSFRTQGLQSLSVMITSFNGFGTLLAVIVTAVFHATPLFLAVSMLAVYLAVLIVISVEGRRRVAWLKPKLIPLTMDRLRPIFGPGMGMNMITLGQGLSIQGTFLAVCSAISPRAGLIYNTTRTVARAGMQLTNMVSYSVNSEFSTALGASDFALAKRLHHRMSQVSFWMAAMAALGLAIFGKPIFLLYTRNAHPRLPFDWPLFGLMLLGLLANGAYSGSMGAPTGVNKHLKMSIYYCIASAISVVSCWIACKYMGLAGAGFAVFELEALMLVIVVPIAIKIIHDDPKEWARAMLRPDFKWLLRRLLKRA